MGNFADDKAPKQTCTHMQNIRAAYEQVNIKYDPHACMNRHAPEVGRADEI